MQKNKRINKNTGRDDSVSARSLFSLKPLAAGIRRAGFSVAGLALSLNAGTAIAGPTGGQVAAGTGSISRPDVNTTLIQQGSQNLILNWDTFNVAPQELVQFNQPNVSAAALNKIFDQNPSEIYGSIRANGRVALINPNGVLFKPGSSVSVGSLIASGLDIKNEDFMSGDYKFNAPEGQEGGVVINQGTIAAATGGSVSLIGGAVSNEGVIYARAGAVNLAAGRQVTMDFDGDGLIQFAVDGEVLANAQGLDDAVSNTGEINADGGSVLLSGKAAANVFTNVVNNEGIIKAGRIENHGGVVRLVAAGDGSTTINTGTIDASSDDGSGGTVQVLGDRVGLFDNSNVDASGKTGGGEVLVGGDLHGANPEIQNATVTYVGENTSIKADAKTEGDGGKVIIWANDTTRYNGDISAKGGLEAGDGGFIEVSSKGHLTYNGEVNASSNNGTAGTLLLDPADINIVGAGTADPDLNDPGTGNPRLFQTTGNTSEILDTVIEGLLDGGTSVTLNTSTEDGGGPYSGTNNGRITQSAQINFAGGANDVTLTYIADENIDISATNGIAITGTPAEKLNVVFTATGDVQIGAAIATNGGTFTSSGVGFSNTGGSITTGGGTVTINHTGAVTIDAAIDAGSGAVSINGSVVILDANIDAQATSGSVAIDVTGTTSITLDSGNDESLTIDANGGDIRLASDSITLDSGTNNDTLLSTGSTGTTTITIQGSALTSTINLGDDAGGQGANLTLTEAFLTGTQITIGTNGFSDIAIGGSGQTGDITIDDNNGNSIISLGASGPNLVLNADGNGGNVIQTAAGEINLSATNGATFTINGWGATTTLNADITTEDGAVTFNDAVIVAADIAIDTTNGGGGTGADITFAAGAGGSGGTIETDGTPRTLEFIAGSTGNISIAGAVGATNEMDQFLVTSAGNVTVDSVRTGDNGAAAQDTIDITAGGTITLNGDLRTDADTTSNDSGNVVINGDVVLGGNISVLTTGTNSDGNVDFSGTIDADDNTGADRTLTINADTGTVTLGGTVGTGTNGALADFDVTGNLIQLGGSVTVNDGAGGATVTFTGSVQLDANVVVDTDGTNDNNVTFTSTINADSAGNDRTLAVTAGGGTVQFGSTVGAGQALAAFDPTANLIRLGGNITANQGAAATMDFTGAVQLDSNVTINGAGTNDHGVNFTSTINADAAANNRTLTLNTGTDASGTITVSGNIGTNQALAGLTVTQSDTATFSGNVIVTANTGTVTLTDTDTTIAFQGGLTATTLTTNNQGYNLSLTGSGTITSDVTFANMGTVTLGDAPADTLVFDGGLDTTGGPSETFLGGTVSTSNDQIDFDVVTLINNASVSSGGAVINFTTTVDADDETTADRTLTVNAGSGTVTFSGILGGGANGALADLDVTAATINLNAGTINVDDANDNGVSQSTVTFTGPVVVGANLTVDTDKTSGTDNNITFTSTVNANAANGRSLMINAGTGTVTSGNIGATNGFSGGITINSGAVTLGTVSSKAVSGNNNAGVIDINAGGNVTIGAINAQGTGTGAGNAVNIDTTTGTISLQSITTTGQTGGNILIDNAVGSTTSGITLNGDLIATDTNGGGDNAGSVTLGRTAQTSVFIVGSSININTSSAGNNDGDITIYGLLDGSVDFTQDLTLTAETGTVLINNLVGTVHDLRDVNIASAGAVTINPDVNGTVATIGIDEANTDDTFLARSLTITASGVVNLGGTGGTGGDFILSGIVGNTLDIESTANINGVVIQVNSNITATTGNILLTTTQGNADIEFTVSGLPSVGNWPGYVAERRVKAIQPGASITTVTSAETFLRDAGSDPIMPNNGMNTVLQAGDVITAGTNKGTNLDDGTFPQIIAATITETFTGDLALGTDATTLLTVTNERDDNQMDNFLSSPTATTLNIIVTSGNIYIDRADPDFKISDGLGNKSLNLVTDGLVTDVSGGAGVDDLALRTTGSLTITSNGTVGIDNSLGGNTDGTLRIDVGTLTILNTGGNEVNITNSGTTGNTVFNISTGGAGNVALQSSNDLLITAITTTGTVSLMTTGSIDDDVTDTVTDITGSSLAMSAGGAIGATEELEIEVPTVTSVTATGDVNIDSNLAALVTLTTLSTSGGNLVFNTVDGLTVNGTIDTTSGTDAGSVTINSDTDDAGAGTFTLTTVGPGTILTNDTGADGDFNLTASTVDFQASSVVDIGDGTFNLTFTQNGSLCLGDAIGCANSLTDSTIDQFVNFSNGSLALSTDSFIRVENVTVLGSLALTAGTTIDDRDDSVTAATLGVSTTGSLTLESGAAIGGASADGDGLTIFAGSLVVTSTGGSGAITITADQDAGVTPTTLTIGTGGINAGTGAVIIRATGAIDNTAGGTVTGSSISLTAEDGDIGSATDPGRVLIDYTAGNSLTLDTSTTTTGSIYVYETTGDLVFSDLTLTTGAGASTIVLGDTDAAGEITIDAARSFAGDDLILDATGTIDDPSGGNTITATTLNLIADAAGGIGATNPINVLVTTQFNADTASGGNNGNVLVNSIGLFPLGLIDAGTGNVTLSSTGNITQNDNGVIDIVATDLFISGTSSAGIGVVSWIETDITHLTASTVGTGADIAIWERDSTTLDGLTLNGGVTTNGGFIDLQIDGDFSDAGNTFETQAVNQDSNSGQIIIRTHAGGTLTLTGTVNASGIDRTLADGNGFSGNFIDIDADGDLDTSAATITSAGGNARDTTNLDLTARTGGSAGFIQLFSLNGSAIIGDVDASGGAAASFAGEGFGALGGNAASITFESGGAGDVTLAGLVTSVGGSGTLNGLPFPLNDGADGTVTIDSQGNVVDNNDPGLDVNAGTLNITSVGDIGTITDFSSGSGNALEVTISGSITAVTTDGDINFDIGNSIPTGTINLTPGGTNDAIIQNSAGNLNVGSVTTSFTTTAGDGIGFIASGILTIPDAGYSVGTANLLLKGVDVRDVTGYDLGTLTANDLAIVSNTASNTTLNTIINSLTADFSGANAGVSLNVSDAGTLVLTDIDTNDGNITVNTTNSITVVDIDTAVDAATSTATVSLNTGASGSIIDGGDAVGDGITAHNIELRAISGIANDSDGGGSTVDDVLELDAVNLAANSSSGDINIEDGADGVNVAAVGTTTGINTGTGDISLTALGATSDILIDDAVITNIRTTDGSIDVTAGHSVIIGTGTANQAYIWASSTGDLSILANNDALAVGGEIDMSNCVTNCFVGATSGKVDLTTAVNGGDINIILVYANTNSASDAVTISSSGAINDSGKHSNFPDANIHAPAGGAVLDATTGVGSSNSIETNVLSIDVQNAGTSGNIDITELNGVTVSALQQTNAANVGGTVTLTTNNGSIDLNDGSVLSQGGLITLTATTGAITDVDGGTTASVTNAGGQASLTAATGIGSAEAIDTDIATINATNNTSGAIQLNESGDLILDQLLNGTRAVTVSAGGAITDGGNDTTSDITAGTVTLTGVGGIGGSGTNAAIDITATTINATNGTSTGIFLNSLSGSAVTFGSILANDAGNIELYSAGDVIIGTSGVVGTGTAMVSTTTGSINDNNPDDDLIDIAASTIDLNATTGIGNLRQLELSGTTISADTSAGAIDLTNNNANPVSVTSLTTTGSDISFSQTGSATPTFTTVTTDGTGTINLSSLDGLSINGDLTTVGTDMTLIAGLGTFDLQGTGSLNTDGGNVVVTALNYNFNGTLNLNGGSLITLFSSVTASLCLGDATGCDIILDNNDLLSLSQLGDLTLDNNAAVLIDNAVFDANLTLSSPTTVDDVDDGGSNYTSTGTLTINASADIGSSSGAEGLNIDIDTDDNNATGDVIITSTSGINVTLTDAGTSNTDYDISTGGSGAVTVVQSANDLIVNHITTASDVSLVASNGAILDQTPADDTTVGTEVNVIAQDISLVANSIGAGADPADFDITLAGTLNVDTSGGPGAVFIHSTGNLNIGQVNAGTANVTLNSEGNITATDDSSADIVGGTVTLTAAVGGIGTGTATSVDVLAGTLLNADTNSGDDSDIFIDSLGNLPVGLVDAGTGDVTLDSTGNITGTNDGTADVNGATIDLIAAAGGINTLEVTAATQLNANTSADSSDLSVESIGGLPAGLIDAGTGNVTLLSSLAITDANGVSNNIVGALLTADAGGGIDLDTMVDNLDASATAAGAITINETGDIDLDGVDTVNGGIEIIATGNITDTDANSLVMSGTGVRLNAGDGIGAAGSTINTSTVALDLTTAGAGALGDVYLVETSNAFDTANILLHTAVDMQTVDLSAPAFIIGGSIGDGSDNIILRATTGNIAGGAGTITAKDLTLEANSLDASIGSLANKVNTSISGSLTASTNNGAGGVFINEAGDLDLLSLTPDTGPVVLMAGGNVTQSATLTLGDIGVSAGGDIVMDDVNNDFTGTTAWSGNNITIVDKNALSLGPTTAAGILDITANSVDIVGAVSATTADIDISAGAGNLTDSGAGSLSVTGLTTLTAGTNNIILDGNNDLNQLMIVSANNAGINEAGGIDVLNSTVNNTLGVRSTGSIQNTSGTVTATNLVLDSTGDIGSESNEFDTDVTGTFDLTTNGGSVFLTDANPLSSSQFTQINTGGGAQTVSLTSTGDFVLNSDPFGDDDVIINPTTNAITLNTSISGLNSMELNGDVTVGGNSSISAAADVSVNGNLSGGGNNVTITSASATVDGTLTANNFVTSGSTTIAGTTNTNGVLNTASGGGSSSFGSTVNAGGAITTGGSATFGDTVTAGGAITTGGDTSFASTVTAAGNVTTGGSTTLNGDVDGNNFIFGGSTLTIAADTILRSTTNSIDFPASVTGTGSLGIDPTDGTDLIISTSGGGTPGVIEAVNFSGLEGHLVIGGTTNPLSQTPIDENTVIDISSASIDVQNPLVSSGPITLLSGEINLAAGTPDSSSDGTVDLISGGGAGGSTVSLIAVGESFDATQGTGATGEITTNGDVTISGGSAVFIAQSTIDDSSQINLQLAQGPVYVATGTGSATAVQFNPASSASGGETTLVDDLIARLTAASFNRTFSVQAQFVQLLNPAQALLGIEAVGFIDTSLFEEELSLFGVIGQGIALSLAQCEEVEGCAPNVSEDELNQLINNLQARLDELNRRLSEEELSGDERTRIEGLRDDYSDQLENFQNYKKQLQEYSSGGGDEEFGDEFGGGEAAPAGPGADIKAQLDRLNGIAETMRKRISWLEDLKSDAEERSRLSEATGIDLTIEKLDAIIEATQKALQSIENEIKLLQEGNQANIIPGDEPFFSAETGDPVAMNVKYGPALLHLSNGMDPDTRWY